MALLKAIIELCITLHSDFDKASLGLGSELFRCGSGLMRLYMLQNYHFLRRIPTFEANFYILQVLLPFNVRIFTLDEGVKFYYIKGI